MRLSLPFEVRFNELLGVQLEGDERAAAAAPPYFIIRPSASATPRASLALSSRAVGCGRSSSGRSAAGVPFDGHQERFSGYPAASVPFEGRIARFEARGFLA